MLRQLLGIVLAIVFARVLYWLGARLIGWCELPEHRAMVDDDRATESIDRTVVPIHRAGHPAIRATQPTPVVRTLNFRQESRS